MPFARVWIQLLKTPFAYLTIAILAFMFIGTYSIKGNTFDIYVLVGAGVVGYIFHLIDIPLTPLVLALILGPMIEDNFQRSLSLSQGDLSILWSGPINATLLAACVLAIGASVVWPAFKRQLARRLERQADVRHRQSSVRRALTHDEQRPHPATPISRPVSHLPGKPAPSPHTSSPEGKGTS